MVSAHVLSKQANKSQLGYRPEFFLRYLADPGGIDVLAKDYLPQGLHDTGDIDVPGASLGAGETGGADPDGPGIEHLLVLKDQLPDHLIGCEVHLLDEGATGGTCPTLVAAEDVLVTQTLNLLGDSFGQSILSCRPRSL